MCAAALDFASERSFIETSEDPYEILDWIADYDARSRDADAVGDDDASGDLGDLIEFAKDRVVELKAVRLQVETRSRSAPSAREVEPMVHRAADVRPPVQAGPSGAAHRAQRPSAPEPAVRRAEAIPAFEPAAPRPRKAADPDLAAQAERTRRRAAEQQAMDQAAAEADAEEQRAADEELRLLRERAAKARARKEAAEQETARIAAEARRAGADAERARRAEARRAAAQATEQEERAAAAAETRAAASRAGPTVSPAAVQARTSDSTGDDGSARRFPPIGPERLFEERLLAEPTGPAAPPATVAAASAKPQPSSPTAAAQNAGAPPRVTPGATKGDPTAPPAPPQNPVDDLPPLTGADLTGYRTWLRASQRVLAAKLGIDQPTICKSEGRATALLPPSLRRALHLAMQEPRDAATKGAM